MHFTARAAWHRRMVLCVFASTLSFVPVRKAEASDVTLGIIGPHEYDLPVDFKPFNVLVQYGDGNAAGSYYNSGGQRKPGEGSHTWSGMTNTNRFLIRLTGYPLG